ncbi:MAG TPA: hypothetical protein VLD83_13660 [Candidatus Binatia bacterium]|nr:hypothetical protein [Candidatus Binatia bacterium]
MATASRNTLQGSHSPTFVATLRQLLTAAEQSRSAKTVEVFGWLILVEGTLVLFVPHVVASLLQIPPLEQQSAHYFRLVGLLVGGLGLLYIVSGRVNSQGFVFASMLDRPLVPLAMAILWYLGIIPGPLALIFSVQDFASFLWTLMTWRGEQQAIRTN